MRDGCGSIVLKPRLFGVSLLITASAVGRQRLAQRPSPGLQEGAQKHLEHGAFSSKCKGSPAQTFPKVS